MFPQKAVFSTLAWAWRGAHKDRNISDWIDASNVASISDFRILLRKDDWTIETDTNGASILIYQRVQQKAQSS